MVDERPAQAPQRERAAFFLVRQVVIQLGSQLVGVRERFDFGARPVVVRQVLAPVRQLQRSAGGDLVRAGMMERPSRPSTFLLSLPVSVVR